MIVWDDWLLTAARAAVHLPTGTAVVSDLHLGYADVRRRGGEAVPLRPVAASLHDLRVLLHEKAVEHLVLAGDVFEAAASPDLCGELLRWIEGIGVRSVRVLEGNHDRGLSKAPEPLRPVRPPVLLGEWQVVHGDGDLPPGRVVQGHIHPALRPRLDLPPVPCFLTRPGHLVLPAYCAEASGVDVSRQERWAGYDRHAVVGGSVLSVSG